jgi:hypothetical protein
MLEYYVHVIASTQIICIGRLLITKFTPGHGIAAIVVQLDYSSFRVFPHARLVSGNLNFDK